MINNNNNNIKNAYLQSHFQWKVIVTRKHGNTGRPNRNLYVMLKFTERPKTQGTPLKKHGFL